MMEAGTDDGGSAESSVCTRVGENEKSVCSSVDSMPVDDKVGTVIISDTEQAGIDAVRPSLESSDIGTCMQAAESSKSSMRMTTAESSNSGVRIRTAESSDMPAAESSNIEMRRVTAENLGINTAERSDEVDAFRDTAEKLSSEKCDEDLGKTTEENMDTTIMESLGLQRIGSTDTVKTGQDLSQKSAEKLVPGFAEKLVSVRSEKEVSDFTENFSVSFIESTERIMQFAEILYKCKLCTSLPSVLTSRDNFLMHVKDFHLKGNSADDFDCDDCDLKFRTSEDLNLHFHVCHGSCEEDEMYTSCIGAKNRTDAVSSINPSCFRDSQSSDYCDMDKSCSESESESDDLNIDLSSNVSNCEIRSSKPKMFNFSGRRGTKTRTRKSVPQRRLDSHPGVDNNNCDIGERLMVKVEPRDSDGYHGNLTSVDPGIVFHESENNRKRKLVHILSPSKQTHTIHWGPGPLDINMDEKVETSDPVCKKIKILDKVVKIPNPNCAEENSTDSDQVTGKPSNVDGDGPSQGTPLMQPIPAIHDMQKYSKYLSRKSFFSMAAHQKLKSSAIYNLISTHMQKDAVAGSHGNHDKVSQSESVPHHVQQNVPKNAQQSVKQNTQPDITRSSNFHNLSASDRLKSFIKHKNDDLSERRTGPETDPVEQNLKVYVQMEPEDFSSTSASHRKNKTTGTSPGKTCGSLPANSLAKCSVPSAPERQHFESESVVEKLQKYSSDSCTSGTDKQEKNIISSAASAACSSSHDLDLPKTNPIPLLNMPTGASYKCFKCDEYFTDFSTYCGHCKRMHDSDMPYGTPIPKMEQCIALVKAIQTILVATHSGYISRESLLKEAAKEIGSTQVESWGAACNRAVKEVFPYSQTHRKGKYKDYYFGVKFVAASDIITEDTLETDEEKPAPPGDNLLGNRQPVKNATKECGVDLERIHRILPDLVAWHGDEDSKVPRADLIDLLRYSLNVADTSSSNWGWQCNRAVRLSFPEVVIGRKGKYKHTYYQGIYYKDPEASKAKLADISSRRKDINLGEGDDASSSLHSEEMDSKSEYSDPTDSEIMEEEDATKEAADAEAHKSLKLRVCRAVANTKGPLTTPRAVQKKLNNVSTVVVTAMLKELSDEGYGTIQQPSQPRGRNKVVFFKSYPGTMREEELLCGTGVSAVTYKENFSDLSDPPIQGMYHRHPQWGLMRDSVTNST